MLDRCRCVAFGEHNRAQRHAQGTNVLRRQSKLWSRERICPVRRPATHKQVMTQKRECYSGGPKHSSQA